MLAKSEKLKNLLVYILFLHFILLMGVIGEPMDIKNNRINLPDALGPWTRQGPPKLVTSENIFDYMNGAGELYLSYHFDSLEVIEYKTEKKNEILVELYYMKGSDDAFGLLSLDWGGEEVVLNPSISGDPKQEVPAYSRALYGKGLLRLWSDNLYARIMATRETDSAKKAILQLGKIITKGRKLTRQPQLLQVLPLTINSEWALKKERTSYFYSHLVLNSQYYLSHENILKLNHSTQVISAPYENIQNNQSQIRIHLLLIKYTDVKVANEALNYFLKVYLPDHKVEKEPPSGRGKEQLIKIEDGWMGYKLINNYLELVFECPDRESAKIILNQGILNPVKKGGIL
jgi:hypothetical protein